MLRAIRRAPLFVFNINPGLISVNPCLLQLLVVLAPMNVIAFPNGTSEIKPTGRVDIYARFAYYIDYHMRCSMSPSTDSEA